MSPTIHTTFILLLIIIIEYKNIINIMMDVFQLLEVGVLSVVCWYWVVHYKNKNVNLGIGVLTWVSGMISMGIMLVVPYDLYFSQKG